MRIAAAAYQAEWHPDWQSLEAKLTKWVEDAVGQAAELLVFPEYAGAEAALVGVPVPRTLHEHRNAMAAAESAWVGLHSTLAARFGIYILAGSGPVLDGTLRNRAYLCGPGGDTIACDKLIPTPYERNELGLSGGDAPVVIETRLGRIAVLTCYDSEFPLLARQVVSAGADVILVPSCTDFPAGHTRVRQSCRARAIEGQCLVVQAPLIGAVDNCGIIDQSTGQVGFFVPPDYGLPDDGILAQGMRDRPGWVVRNVDIEQVTAARKNGQVGNFAQWPEQERHVKPVTVQRLD
jgi:predicted amidohydrolase